jgi:hypothetical protein
VPTQAVAGQGGDDRATGVAAPPSAVRRRAGGRVIISCGVVLLLLGALWVSTPPEPMEDDLVCGDAAALTLALRPQTDTSAACRDLAVEDTLVGGGMAALGVVMLVWWRVRRRSSEGGLAAGEPGQVGGDRTTGVAAPTTAVRRPPGHWRLLWGGVGLLLVGALLLGLPPGSEEEGIVCGDEAALTLAFRPRTDTSAACRDLAVADTVLGGGIAALGVVMLVWLWVRRRSFDEDLAAGEPADVPQVPRPREVLPIPDLQETGLSTDRLAVHPYTSAGFLLATAAVLPFVLLQLARTLPGPDADVSGVMWLLAEAWFYGYLMLSFGAASLLWGEAAAQLMRHPVLVLDRHGLAAEDKPFVAWTEVADLTFGTGRTEDEDELAVLELRLRPTDGGPARRTVRYDLEGLTAEPGEIAALARSLHQDSIGWAAGQPTSEPGDLRPAWRAALVLAAAAGLLVASIWLGLLVAGGWPAGLQF